MALTPNHKIYSPDISDRAQARTQMATMASSVEAALNIQTANLAELEAWVSAREKIFATHAGDGTWAFADGLGEPMAVHDAGDGDWQVMS